MKKAMLSLLLFLFILPVVTESATNAQKVLRVSDGKVISFEQMIDDLKKVSVVFVGEVHDEPEHHQAELRVLRAMHQSNEPFAVGLEMFRAESQKKLDSWTTRKISLDQFLQAYYDNWRQPWPLYRDIFEYARENQIPLVGLNIPDSISKKVGANGFGSLTPDEKKQLPPGISCNVDPTYMEFIRKAYSGHHAAGDREFVNFCEAQMVWDKSMAWHLAGYLKKNPGKRMIVLAGVGHAWKRGISEQLPAESKLTYRVVLPVIPNEADKATRNGPGRRLHAAVMRDNPSGSLLLHGDVIDKFLDRYRGECGELDRSARSELERHAHDRLVVRRFDDIAEIVVAEKGKLLLDLDTHSFDLTVHFQDTVGFFLDVFPSLFRKGAQNYIGRHSVFLLSDRLRVLWEY